MNELVLEITVWHWAGLSALLIILEVLLGTSFFLLWLGICAGIVAILFGIYPELPWQYQLVIFSIIAVACILFWHVYLKHHPTKTDKPNLNRRSEQYVGRIFDLNEPIVNGRGKIHVDDSSWRVEGPDLPAGSKVKVIGVNGVILKINPVGD